MELAEIKCEDPTGSGLVCEHNMPCAICGVNHAVIRTNSGVFGPCWDCQTEGWDIVRSPKKFGFWRKLGGWFMGYYEFSLNNSEEMSPRRSDWV